MNLVGSTGLGSIVQSLYEKPVASKDTLVEFLGDV